MPEGPDVLDQAFLAGLGHYLRVEILWQAGLAAHHRAGEKCERCGGVIERTILSSLPAIAIKNALLSAFF